MVYPFTCCFLVVVHAIAAGSPAGLEGVPGITNQAIMRREPGADVLEMFEDDEVVAAAAARAATEGLFGSTPTTTAQQVLGTEGASKPRNLWGTVETTNGPPVGYTIATTVETTQGPLRSANGAVEGVALASTTAPTTSPFGFPYASVVAPTLDDIVVVPSSNATRGYVDDRFTPTIDAPADLAAKSGSATIKDYPDDRYTTDLTAQSESEDVAHDGSSTTESPPITPPMGLQRENSISDSIAGDMLRVVKTQTPDELASTLGDSIGAGSDLGLGTPPAHTDWDVKDVAIPTIMKDWVEPPPSVDPPVQDLVKSKPEKTRVVSQVPEAPQVPQALPIAEQPQDLVSMSLPKVSLPVRLTAPPAATAPPQVAAAPPPQAQPAVAAPAGTSVVVIPIVLGGQTQPTAQQPLQQMVPQMQMQMLPQQLQQPLQQLPAQPMQQFQQQFQPMQQSAPQPMQMEVQGQVPVQQMIPQPLEYAAQPTVQMMQPAVPAFAPQPLQMEMQGQPPVQQMIPQPLQYEAQPPVQMMQPAAPQVAQPVQMQQQQMPQPLPAEMPAQPVVQMAQPAQMSAMPVLDASQMPTAQILTVPGPGVLNQASQANAAPAAFLQGAHGKESRKSAVVRSRGSLQQAALGPDDKECCDPEE